MTDKHLARLLYGGGYLLDDVSITAGIGTPIATELIGGRNIQLVKPVHGVAGAAVDVSLTTGLPVQPMTSPGATPFPVSPGLKLTESYTRLALSFNTINDNAILAAVAAQFIRIYGILLIPDSPVSVKFGENGATYYTGAMKLTSGIMLLPQGEPYFISTLVNKSFVINLSAAVQCSGVLWYQQGV